MVSISAAGSRWRLNQLYDRYLGPNWREEPANGECGAARIPFLPKNCGALMSGVASDVVGWARNQVRDQRIRRGAPQVEIEAADEVLDPDALTIGFARRFATYKRATLIFRDYGQAAAHADRQRASGAIDLRRQGASAG